jgi:hypothetical protein
MSSPTGRPRGVEEGDRVRCRGCPRRRPRARSGTGRPTQRPSGSRPLVPPEEGDGRHVAEPLPRCGFPAVDVTRPRLPVQDGEGEGQVRGETAGPTAGPFPAADPRRGPMVGRVWMAGPVFRLLTDEAKIFDRR